MSRSAAIAAICARHANAPALAAAAAEAAARRPTFLERIGSESLGRTVSPPAWLADTAALPLPACQSTSSTSVLVFLAPTADSTTPPARKIGGPHTALCGPRGLALGGRGELHVLNTGSYPKGKLVRLPWASSLTVHTPEAQGDATPVRTLATPTPGINPAAGIALDRDGYIYVTSDEPGTIDLGSVTVYERGAAGDVEPIRTILGRRTVLSRPEGVAVDPRGLLYVASPDRDAVTVYARGADGDLAPVRVIAGHVTGLVRPVGVALDRRGNLYVANTGRPGREEDESRVSVYAPGASGDFAPIRDIEDRALPPYTLLRGPAHVALDAHDTLYVATASAVIVYAPGANGRPTPVRTLGYRSRLNGCRGIALDRRGALYVVNDGGSSVAVYAAGAGGDAQPIRTIRGGRAALAGAFDIAIDRHDTLYVTTAAGVTIYAPGASGDVAPVRTIAGNRTGLSAPIGVALDRRGRVYVTNGPRPRGGGAVQVYAPRAEGAAAAARTITGAATGLAQPTGAAFDSRGDLYVVNAGPQGAGLVTVYDRHARGNAAPLRTLTGPNTYLRRPIRIAFGRADTLYVLNAFTWWKYGTDYVAVTVYAPGASGDAAPVRIISVTEGRGSVGHRLGLNWPEDIAVDREGAVYLANYYPRAAVAVYGPGVEGEVAPTRLMTGPKTGLTGPKGLAVNDRGMLYVANVHEPAGFTLDGRDRCPSCPRGSPQVAGRADREMTVESR